MPSCPELQRKISFTPPHTPPSGLGAPRLGAGLLGGQPEAAVPLHVGWQGREQGTRVSWPSRFGPRKKEGEVPEVGWGGGPTFGIQVKKYSLCGGNPPPPQDVESDT